MMALPRRSDRTTRVEGGERLRVAFTTFGCKLNQWDTQQLARAVAGRCEIVSFDSEADVYVVNTCTVTSGSDAQVRQLIRRTRSRRPDARLFVTGCYARRAAAELLGLGCVSLLLGEDPARTLAELLGAGGDEKERASVPAPHRGRSRAYLAVQRGCNRDCSYCIVPHVRGPARSLPRRQIERELEKLLEAGYAEIVLTATNLGDYGRDLGDGEDLSGLIRWLDRALEGHARLRLSSLSPQDITPEMVRTAAECRNLCKHFHVAFQSADDAVLRAMRRGYGEATVREALGLLCDAFEYMGLGGDVMVGFPGETDRSFARTLAVVQEFPFSYLHVFTFSPRPGTDAKAMAGCVPNRTAKQRSATLRDLARIKGLEFARRSVGRCVSTVVEASGPDGCAQGTSGEYLRVQFEDGGVSKGRCVSVQIRRAVAARMVWGDIVAN